MRRRLITTVGVVVLFSLLVASVGQVAATDHSSSSVEINATTSNSTVAVGDKVPVYVRVNASNSSVYALSTTTEFDPATLSVLNVSEGPFLGQGINQTLTVRNRTNSTSGIIEQAYTRTGNESATGTGTYAIIWFEVLQTPNSTTAISISDSLAVNVTEQTIATSETGLSLSSLSGQGPESGNNSAGGGGGGGGVPVGGEQSPTVDIIGLDSGATIYVEEIPSGANANISLNGTVSGNGVSIPSLNIQHRIAPSGYRVEMTDPQSEPSGEAPPLGKTEAISYFNIEAIGEEVDRISGATVKFSVDPASLPASIAEDALVLYRYTGSEWQTEETEYISTANRTLTYQSTVSGFSAFAIGSSPATVSVSSVNIENSELSVGESIAITAKVVNNQTQTSTHDITLHVNDTAITSKTVEVPAGSTKRVSFTFSPDVVGTYTITVGDTEAGSVVVREAQSPTTNSTDKSATEGTEDSTPGFGVGVSLIATLLAALLARRRSGR